VARRGRLFRRDASGRVSLAEEPSLPLFPPPQGLRLGGGQIEFKPGANTAAEKTRGIAPRYARDDGPRMMTITRHVRTIVRDDDDDSFLAVARRAFSMRRRIERGGESVIILERPEMH